MGEIRTTITLTDRISATLNKIHGTMSKVAKQATGVNTAIKRQDAALNKTTASAKYFVNAGNKIVDAQGRFVSATKIAELGLKKENLALRKVGKQAHKTGKAFSGLGSKMKGAFTGLSGLIGGIAIGAMTNQLVKQSDAYANMNARIGMINDGMQTTKQLQESIYKSAQLTGSAYNDVANGVAKMRMQAGEVFTNNAETLAFLETMNKSFIVGGASIEEQKSAMLQLTQAMASGKLQGDELRSLAETSPALIQAISSYLGVSRGEIKKLGAEGKLTADIVKNAMLSATDKINGEFEQMPKTWGRIWQEMKNYSLKALEPVLQKLNDFVNSERGARMAEISTKMITVAANAFEYVVDGIIWIYDQFGWLYDWVKANWDWLGPIIKGITMAVISFRVLNSTVGRAMKLFSMARTAIGGLGGALRVAKTSQLGLSGAMAACPFNWYILAIAGAIGALYLIVAAINRVAGTSISATGIIMGAVMTVYTFVYNIVAQLFNIVMAFAEFLINVFIDPMYAIQMLWYNLVQAVAGYLATNLEIVDAFINGAVGLFFELDFQAQTAWYNIAQGCYNMAGAIGMAIDSMINSVIGGIEGMLNSALSGINDMINAMNKIPKVDIPNIGTVSLGRASTGTSMQSAISSMSAPAKKSWSGSNMSGAVKNFASGMAKPTTDKSVWTAPKMEFKSILDGAQKGYDAGSTMADKFNNLFTSHEDKFDEQKPSDILKDIPKFDMPGGLDGPGGKGGKGGGNPTGGKLDSVGKIDDEIEIDDEVLKLIKDVANQEYQQKFIKLEPKIVTNIGEINNKDEYANSLDDLNAKIVNAINNGADGI